MKFTAYEQQVNPTVANARVVAPNNPMAYGDMGKGTQAMAAAVGQIAKVAQKKQDEDDAADVMEARSKISQQLNADLYGDGGIIATGQGKNYAGLADRVTDKVKEVTNDISKEYNGRVRNLLQTKFLNEDLTNYGKMGIQREGSEREKYHTAQYTTGIANIKNDLAEHYDDDTFIDSKLKEYDQMRNSRGQELGWDGSTDEAEKASIYTSFGSSLMGAAEAKGDYARAESLLNKFRPYMNQDTYYQNYKQLSERKKNIEDYSNGEQIAKAVFNFDTGVVDTKKLEELIKQKIGINNFDYEDGTRKGFKAIKGQRMPDGGNGCVEAAVRIASYVSPYMAKEDIQKINNVDTLLDAVQKDANGPKVVDFNASKVEPGDIIVYDRNGDKDAKHVVVAAGGTKYYGNSTEQEKVIEGSDYNQMGSLHPYKLIKTGGSKTIGLNFDINRQQNLRKNVNAFVAEYKQAWQQEQESIKEQFLDQIQKEGLKANIRQAIQDSKLAAGTKMSLLNMFDTHTRRNVTGGGRVNTGGRRLTQTDDISEESYQNQMDYITLRNWQADSSSVPQSSANAAAYRYNKSHGLGGINGDQLNDPNRWSDFTDLVEANPDASNEEIKAKLISWGWSETEADWYIAHNG